MPFSLACRNSQPCSHIRPQSLKSPSIGCLELACGGTLLRSQEVKRHAHSEHVYYGYMGSLQSQNLGLTLYCTLTWTSLSFLSPNLAHSLSSPSPLLSSHPGWLGLVTAEWGCPSELCTVDTPTATKDGAEFQLMTRSAGKAWLCWPPMPAPSERLQGGILCCPGLEGLQLRQV